MLIESLQHLFSLDLGWFIDLAFGNLGMLFILLAVSYFFLEGQNLIKGSIIIFATLFALFDFEIMLEVVLFSTGFFAIHYMSKLSVLGLAENSESLKKHMIFINEMQFFAALAVSLLFF